MPYKRKECPFQSRNSIVKVAIKTGCSAFFSTQGTVLETDMYSLFALSLSNAVRLFSQFESHL